MGSVAIGKRQLVDAIYHLMAYESNRGKINVLFWHKIAEIICDDKGTKKPNRVVVSVSKRDNLVTKKAFDRCKDHCNSFKASLH